MISANLYRRFFAFLFDWMLVQCMFLIMLFVGLMALKLRSETQVGFDGGLGMSFLTHLWLFIFFSYNIFFLYNGGQTPAKKLFKIKVVGLKGQELSFSQALLRSFGYIVSSIMLFGFIISMFTEKNRSFHDFIGRTRVIETGPSEEFVTEVRSYL